MKRLKYIFLTLLSLITLVSFSQQSIGSFPTMNGGFEATTTGALGVSSSIANTTTSSNWTKDNTSLTATINSTSPRTGTRYLTCQNTTATAYRIQSPTVNTNGAIANTLAYTVQYYYKTANTTAVTNFQRAISPDGTGSPGTYGTTTMAGTSSTWTKIQVSQTSGSSASATKYGIGILRLNGASAVSVDIDDYVVYAGSADNTAPSAPTSPTITAASCTSLNVSWAAASGGVDGGGYMVVRGTSDPTTTPNTQGIYDLNGTLGTGTIVYIGTNTSFTDNSLTTNTTYYYRIYTLDKAFNYSSALTGNGTTSSPSITTNPSNVTINNGSNTTFNVVATNSPSSYTWQVSTNGGSSWSNVSNGSVYSGATTATLTLTSADYTMNGYQYKVTATNGCGSSTSTVATLNVNATIPVTGSNSYTMCSGILYDDGGTGNYSTYVSGYSVIYPSTSGSMVRVSGTLNIENGYDYITIYNGVGTSGTVLWGGSTLGSGTSCGNYTIPTITSTSGPLTVLFTSDVSGVCSGMVLNVSCFTPAYQAQITSINTGSSSWCSGEVRQVTVTVKNTGTATWTNSSPDINVGVKWNADADYFYRTDVGGLAPGQTQTYSINVTAPSNATTSNLTFDLVYEGCFWFASNPGSSCGTTCQGNSVYTSPSITVNPTPSVVTVTSPSTTICNGSSVSLTANGGTTSGAYISGGLTTINGLTGAPAPLSNYFGGDKTQMLFTAAELTSLGYVSGDRITSLGFAISTVGTTTSLTNFQIDYKFVSGATTTLTSTFQTGLTTVKTSFTWSLPTTGLPIWSFVTFDTPIIWDGTSSLVLQTCYSNSNTGSSSSSVQTYLSAIGANRCVYYRADGTSFTTILANATGTTSGNRPDVRLGWTKNAIWSWSPNTSTSNAVSVSPTLTTNYIATSTSSAGCTSSGNLTINVSPTSVAGTVNSDQTICYGSQPNALGLVGNTGTIQWQVSTDNITFSNITGATTSPLSTNQMGVLTSLKYYRAVVTSGVCSSINSNTVTVNVSPTSVSGTANSNQTICSGGQPSNITLVGNTGTIQWQVSSDNITYNDIVGSTNSTLTSAQMGVLTSTKYYRAVVTSGVCSPVNSNTITITINPTPSITSSGGGTVCLNSSQTLSSSVIGGTGSISYQWQSCSTANGTYSNVLGATSSTYNAPTNTIGTTYYKILATYSGNGCGTVTSNTVSVTTPTSLVSGNHNTTALTICQGGNPNTLNIGVPSGGISPYTYQWKSNNVNITGETTSSYNSPAMNTVGTYSINCVTTDACGTQVSSTPKIITVVNDPTITLQPVSSSTVCLNGSLTLSITATAGTPSLTYQWYSNTSASTTGGTLITGAVSTTYVVPTNTQGIFYYYCKVSASGSGCSTTTSTVSTITVTSLPSSIITSINVSCNGGSNGSINLTVNNGTSPYTYSWSNGSTTQNLSGLQIGNYSVTITDINGCQSTNSVTITQPSSLSSTVITNSVSCYGGTNGSITLSVTGGTTPYTYLWSNGSITQNLSNLSTGIYGVTVTDANGCTTTNSSTVTQPSSALSSSYTSINVSCNGGNDGSIDLTSSGGTSGYTYLWSNSSTTQDIISLTAGDYSVTITDVNGCQTTNTVTITQPSVLSSTHTQFNPSCFGSNNGSINLTPSGGTSPYTFLWSNGQTTEDIFSLVANTYSVTVTDSKGCQTTRTVTITQPTQLTTTVTTTNVNCYGGNNGSASVTASGGTPPYLYMWNTGNTQSSISNLTSGNYQITVTDNKGCTKITNLNISQPSELSVSLDITTYPNCGSSNGVVSSSVIGGTPPFTYSWSNGQTTQNLTGAASGNYTLTVTDSKGCQSISPMTLGCTSAIINVGQIQGLTSICGLSSGSYTIDYSNASPESITWILPNGITSNNGLSNPTINVNFSSGFVQDSIEVDVVSNGVTYHRAIWVTKLPNKPIVSGSFCGEPTGSIKSYIVTNSQPNMSYNWVSPYGVNVYSGQGNDTVQFKASIMLVSGSGGSVTATNSCGSSTTQFTIDRLVVRPTSILGPTTVCADGNTIYTYRVDSVPTSFMYIWNVPNGVSIIGTSYNDTLKVKFSTNFTSGQFSVMSVNKCGSSPMTYGTVSNNNLYSNIGTITGPGDLCPYLGQSVTYSVTNQSGTFTWSVPTNMTIQTGQGTNSITVIVSNSFSSGTISVNLNNGCGGSISSSKTLSTTTSTISTSSISGVRSVCSLVGTSTSTTFSVTPISGVNYVWSVPANSTIVSGQGTNSINVTFQNGFTGGNIQVIITGGCGNPITRTRLVDLGLPSVSISGVNCVDNGYTNTYSVSTTGALSFNWTVPGNAQIVRGQGTNSIDVFFPNNFESTSCINNSCDSIRLTTQFGCGSVLSKKKIGLLTVRPTVTGTSSVCFPDTIRLTASTSPRITSYIWSNSNGTQFIGSTTGNTVMAKTSSSFIGGTFSVMGVNSCGSSPMAYFGVNKVCPNTTKTIGLDEYENNKLDFITFPNPGKGIIEFRVFKSNDDYYLVQIKNNLGQLVYEKLKEKEDTLDLGELKPGVYFITVSDYVGNIITKQLMIL